MESNKITLCITGAAGNIAYSLIPMVVSGQLFGPRTSIDLTLLDLPATEAVLKGISMELIDGAYNLLSSCVYSTDPKVTFKQADVVIFLGGSARKPGQERRDLLQDNVQIFKDQGKILNEVGKPTCKCLVVANPCNTNCLILQQNCPKIPKKNFTALTRLDHNRAISTIAQKLDVDPQKIKKLTIWGNHSVLQYPDLSHCEYDGKKVKELVKDENYMHKDFISTIQNRGGQVLFQRKKASGFSAAKAIVDHMRDWQFGTEKDNWTSMAVVSDGSYGIKEGLVYSLPVKCKDFSYEIVKGLELDEFSKEMIEVGINEIQDEIDEATEEVEC